MKNVNRTIIGVLATVGVLASVALPSSANDHPPVEPPPPPTHSSPYDYSLLAGAGIVTGANAYLPSSIAAGAGITTGAGTVIDGNLYAGGGITTGAGTVVHGALNAEIGIALGAGTINNGPVPGNTSEEFTVALHSANAELLGLVGEGGETIAGELGATTLTHGVYSTPSFFTLTGTLTLDAEGDSSAKFIIMSPGYTSIAAGSSVVLTNGAVADNVVWVTSSYFSAGAGASLVGNIMATSYATLGAGAELTGRIFSQSGYVTLGASVQLKPTN
jgi:hypothetical protein